MTAPGTARPGGRTARVTESVFAAAIAELSARDYADISVESIAARAGVHKTTVYRRWGSKAEIIRQALAGAATAGIPVPDTGGVDEDLRTLARAVQAVLSAPAGAAITRALVVLIGFRQAGVAIASVSVAKPTLDEVFLAITGHGTGQDDDPDAAEPAAADIPLEVIK